MMLHNTPETREKFVLRVYDHYNDVNYFQNIAGSIYESDELERQVVEILSDMDGDPYPLAYPVEANDIIWGLCTSGH